MEETPVPEIRPNARRTPRRPKRERRFIKRTVVISVLLAVVLLLGAFVYSKMRPTLTGRNIDRAIAAGDVTKALALTAALTDEDMAAEYGSKCSYAMALQALENGEYQNAEDRFMALGDYADARDMAKRCAYESALLLYNRGDYKAAAEAFVLLGEYQDAAERLRASRYALADALEQSGDMTGAVELFALLGEYQDAKDRAGALAVQLTGESDPVKALSALTSLSEEEQQALIRLNTLRKELREHIVAAGFHHTVALKDDGAVLACGRNDEGQCGVAAWTEVVAVDAGAYHTVALKKDGTALACGRNDEGQCDVSAWTELIAIAAGDYTTYGLKKDGTVVCTGFQNVSADVASWPAVSDITAGAYTLVGLSGGTAYATHPSARSSELTDLVSAGVSTGYAVGLKADSTLVCSSDAADLSDLPQSVALSCSSTYVAVLGADGALHAHFFRQSEAFDMKADAMLVAFDAGNLHLVAVTEDGRVLAFGANSAGACNTIDWKLWG